MVVFLSGFLIWSLQQHKEAVSQASLTAGQKTDPSITIVVKGISCREFKGGRCAYSLKADECRIHPGAFGVFSIQPIKKATLVNAIIEVYLSPRDNPLQGVDILPSSSAAFSQESEKLPTKGIGTITLSYDSEHPLFRRGP